jgi:alpha-1,6-mannosyltransferase
MENSGPSCFGGRYPGVPLALVGAIGLLSAVIYGVNFSLGQWIPPSRQATSIHIYLALFAVLSALYLAAVWLVIKCRPTPRQSKGLLAGILAFAVVFRLLLVFQEPAVLSNDMYRFIWDGRVQHHGINPFRHPPGDQALKGLRDGRIYPHINRKTARTLYPAGAQLFFRAVYALVGDSVIGFKSAMVVCDISALALLAALLNVHGRDPNRLLIYAWNPLVVFEIAYSGHLEGITVLLMVSAFYLAARGGKLWGAFVLALSSAVKLYPALLLPALLNRAHRIKGTAVFVAAFGLLYLPFTAAGSKMTGFLPVYLKNRYESFNLGLKSLILHFFPGLNYYLLSLLFIAGLLTVALVVLFKEKGDDRMVFYGYIVTGWLMVLMPAALHPWYVILIIPFLTFYPHVAWLIFSCTVSLSYLKYVTPQGIMPTWVLLCEYLPLMTLLLGGWVYRRLACGAAGRTGIPAGADR